MVCIYKDMLMKIRKNNLLTITVLPSATGHHMAVFGVYTYFLFLMIPCGSDAGDLGSIPVLGRSPGEGKGYPLLSLLAWRILWIVTRATNPPQSWKFKYNFIVGRPYPWFWIPQFNQAWIVSSCASYLSEKKSTYQWVRIVQTCVVQRSTVIRYEEVVYYYYFILCCFDH